MPISILLIEGDSHRAAAVADALGAARPHWQVEVVAPAAARRPGARAAGPPDLVLVAQRTLQSHARKLWPAFQGAPLLVLAPGGAAAPEAPAPGTGPPAVAAPEDLHTLPERVEAVLEQRYRVFQTVCRAQAMALAGSELSGVAQVLLAAATSLTQSTRGWLASAEHDGATGRLLWHVQAAIGAPGAADPDTGRIPRPGDRLPWDTDPLAALAALPFTGDPAAPEPRPALQLPAHAGGELVALVTLAGRSGGYTAADAQLLQPLLDAAGELEAALGTRRSRDAADADLRRHSAELADKVQALQGTLDGVPLAIASVDGEGRVQAFNRRCRELLDLPESLLAAHPTVSEVTQLQVARGDLGDGFGVHLPAVQKAAAAVPAAQAPAPPGTPAEPATQVQRTRDGRSIEVRTCALADGGAVHTLADVTEDLRTLEALRQSESRWRSLSHLSSDWYWEQDAQFRFVRLDGNPKKAAGVPDEMHYGKTRWELPRTLGTEEQWREHRRQLEAHEVFLDFEVLRLAEDGKPLWVSVSGEPIFDDQGHFTGYRGLARDITERKLAEARIQHLAFYDELTGLPNRRLLIEQLERAVQRSARDGRHAALLFLDLDNFKSINDTLGHEWGDRLLVQVGERISASVRSSDIVARLGGDEFVVVLPGLEPATAGPQAQAVAQKVLAALNQPYLIQHSEVHSTPSIGIVLFQDGQLAAQDLLQRADLAMYQAKARGRNTLCFFDPAMQAEASARLALEGEMRQGLQRGEFVLHYQPVVNEAGDLLGTEALVRWHHPLRGLVHPADFIPLAEMTGLILPLRRQVLTQAGQQLAQWAGAPRTAAWRVAVNVSAQEFRQPDFVQEVLSVLRECGADPARLTLELTESLLLHDVEDSIAKMQALRAHGVSFSLDDFGTGYSSLSYLKRLPIDQLKIDQSFVHDVLADPNDATIACTIITLAHSLGLDVVAEGVENEGQRAFLLRNGCRHFQGYLFGRPVPAASLSLLSK